jgi:predicted PurR-regulated permease PerM
MVEMLLRHASAQGLARKAGPWERPTEISPHRTDRNLNQPAATNSNTGAETASLALAAAALLLAVGYHLIPALFAGLLVHVLVHLLAPRMFGFRDQPARARFVVVLVLTLLIVGLMGLMIFGAVVIFRSHNASLALLMQRMAEIIEGSRANIPAWLQDSLPPDADALREVTVTWLRSHAAELGEMGGGIGRAIAYALIGMVVGALIALRETRAEVKSGPLAHALSRRAAVLEESFRRVVLAQVRIAALNASLAAVYLLLVLPILDVHLPFTKTLVALRCGVGLLPIVGNLISNTAIVLGALVFLVLVHKLEYFVNARIVGSQIRASAWELLVAMLVMEAAFGLQGVVAAPVFYAYLKAELAARRLV